jgi:hypothetical protein
MSNASLIGGWWSGINDVVFRNAIFATIREIYTLMQALFNKGNGIESNERKRYFDLRIFSYTILFWSGISKEKCLMISKVISLNASICLRVTNPLNSCWRPDLVL